LGEGVSMSSDSFDDLLQALQSALFTAQDALRRKNAEALGRKLGAEGASGSPASFFSFVMPQWEAGQAGEEMFTLPSASFRMQHRPQVTGLSLTFECELLETRFPAALRGYSLVILDGDGRSSAGSRRQMQIVFQGADRPCGEVRLDGKLLMALPRHEDSRVNSRLPQRKLSVFAKGMRLLQQILRPHGFLMTKEQSERVRSVLG